MFQKGEIKRNLLGCLDVALFMPSARERFGKTYEEAMRSFIIPFLFFPVTLMVVYMFPLPGFADNSANTIALLYSLRAAATWALFFGTIYWLTGEIDRRQHFYQFVVAMNWLTVPATVVFLPVAWMLLGGSIGWGEIQPILMSVMFYTYVFTAFMATQILRIPWELGGFVCMVSIVINNSTADIVHWLGAVI